MQDWDINYLRVGASFLTGYFLSLAGSMSQIVTQNPLASPSTLGLDALAVLCILIAHAVTFWSLSILPLEFTSLLLFLGMGFILSLIYFYKKRKAKVEGLYLAGNLKTIILIGLGINLFVGAIFSVVQFLFMSMNYQFPSGLWFGSFRYISMEMMYIYIMVFIICLILMSRFYHSLRLVSLGTAHAYGLGINVAKLQKKAMLFSLCLTVATISFFGVFSFLGLIFPHLIRRIPFIGTDIKKELLYGPLFCGLFLMGLDYLCYNLPFYGAELPVGMISSVLGSMILLLMLLRQSGNNKHF